jgi:hypothetical protein
MLCPCLGAVKVTVPVLAAQVELENISEQLRIPGGKALGPIMGSVRKSHSILKNDQAKIVRDFAPDKKVRVSLVACLGSRHCQITCHDNCRAVLHALPAPSSPCAALLSHVVPQSGGALACRGVKGNKAQAPGCMRLRRTRA